ncbi:MFS transporter [Caldilinea sp.]|uniref:MFS transporter n=1 Tax=Caldilinea sp. TaxID=2293560 RepID=UPI0021DE1747|nr:MFS transporter [Caldilinea sp.]GIV68515.1 MAG: MFS transporter [Caldilinea sp.]
MNVYISLLQRNRNFRNLWLARVVSNLGDWFNLLASAALIAHLSGAGTAISFLFLARFLPLFVMSPFAGVLADRYERRTLLIWTDILRAVVVLGFLLVDRPERIWLLYLLTVLQFMLSAVFTPAQQSYLPAVVDREDLVTANALDSFTWSTMLALGALLGGVATAFLGVQAAFLLDALTFLISAWFLAHVTVRSRAQASAQDGRSAVRRAFVEIVEGMRYLGAQPVLLTFALVKAAGALVWGSVNVLEIPLAENVFPLRGSGTLSLGLIYAAVGVGTGFGPILLRAWLGDSWGGLLKAVSVGFFAMTLGTLGLAMAPSLGWVLGATAVRGVGTGALWVFSAVLLQLLLPDRLRGRVFAFEFAALTLTQSISTLWAGYAYDNLGWSLGETLFSAGVVSIFATAGWMLFYLRVRERSALLAEAER